jgi:hypothetical protein
MTSNATIVAIVAILASMFVVLTVTGSIPWQLIMPANTNTAGFYAPFAQLVIVITIIALAFLIIFAVLRRVFS